MARKSESRVVRAIADVMWKRDRLQMRAVEAVLTKVAAPPRRRAKPTRKSSKRPTKRRR